MNNVTELLSVTESTVVIENSTVFANETANFTGSCVWQSNHGLFQAGNALCLLSYLAPNGIYGMLFLHSTLIFGFSMLVGWSLAFVCGPDIFAYNLFYLTINLCHAATLLWQVRPMRLTEEMREAYREVFKPLNVPIYEFRKLVAEGVCRVQVYDEGEFYAQQYRTRCDRLGLLIRGCFIVRHDNITLHRVSEFQFIDSSEFEQDYAAEMERLGSKKKKHGKTKNEIIDDEFVTARDCTQSNSDGNSMRHRSESGVGSGDSHYGVSIQAGMYSCAIVWQRAKLLRVLRREPFLAAVFASLIGRDITDKLYALQSKIRVGSAVGAHYPQQPLDIRLPSVANLLAVDQSNAGGLEPPSSLSRRFVEQGQFERRAAPAGTSAAVGANALNSIKETGPSHPAEDAGLTVNVALHRKLTSLTEHLELDETEDAVHEVKPLAVAVESSEVVVEPIKNEVAATEDTDTGTDDVFFTPHASVYFSQSNESLALRLAFHDNV